MQTSVSTSSSATSLPLVSRRHSLRKVRRGAEGRFEVVFGRQEAVNRISNDVGHADALSLGPVMQTGTLRLGQVNLCSNSCHIQHGVYSAMYARIGLAVGR